MGFGICILLHFSEKDTSFDLVLSVYILTGVSCSFVGHLKSLFISVKDSKFTEILKTASKH